MPPALANITARLVAFTGDENAGSRSRLPLMERSAMLMLKPPRPTPPHILRDIQRALENRNHHLKAADNAQNRTSAEARLLLADFWGKRAANIEGDQQVMTSSHEMLRDTIALLGRCEGAFDALTRYLEHELVPPRRDT